MHTDRLYSTLMVLGMAASDLWGKRILWSALMARTVPPAAVPLLLAIVHPLVGVRALLRRCLLRIPCRLPGAPARRHPASLLTLSSRLAGLVCGADDAALPLRLPPAPCKQRCVSSCARALPPLAHLRSCALPAWAARRACLPACCHLPMARPRVCVTGCSPRPFDSSTPPFTPAFVQLFMCNSMGPRLVPTAQPDDSPLAACVSLAAAAACIAASCCPLWTAYWREVRRQCGWLAVRIRA